MNAIVPYSDSNQQPSVFSFNGHNITVRLDQYGDVWFDGPEVCRATSIVNASQAYTRLDDDEKQPLSQIEGTPPQNGVDRIYVSESGMYNLILRSDKPEAKAFKKFVTAEVLPSIRKTGSYSVQALTPTQALLKAVERMVEIEQQVTTIQRQQDELQRQQADQAIGLEAVNERVTQSEYYTVRQWCQLQRMSGIKYSVMQQWGKRAAALSRAREVEIQRVNEGENNVGSYHKSILIEVCVIKPKSDPDQLRLGA